MQGHHEAAGDEGGQDSRPSLAGSFLPDGGAGSPQSLVFRGKKTDGTDYEVTVTLTWNAGKWDIKNYHVDE